MEREGGGGGKSSSCRGWRVARNVSKRLARQRSGGSCTDCHQQQQRQSSKSRAIDLLIQPSRLRPNPKGPPTIPYSSHHRFQPSKQKRLAKKRRRSWKKREWNGSSDQGEFEASFTPSFFKKKTRLINKRGRRWRNRALISVFLSSPLVTQPPSTVLFLSLMTRIALDTVARKRRICTSCVGKKSQLFDLNSFFDTQWFILLREK